MASKVIFFNHGKFTTTGKVAFFGHLFCVCFQLFTTGVFVDRTNWVAAAFSICMITYSAYQIYLILKENKLLTL